MKIYLEDFILIFNIFVGWFILHTAINRHEYLFMVLGFACISISFYYLFNNPKGREG